MCPERRIDNKRLTSHPRDGHAGETRTSGGEGIGSRGGESWGGRKDLKKQEGSREKHGAEAARGETTNKQRTEQRNGTTETELREAIRAGGRKRAISLRGDYNFSTSFPMFSPLKSFSRLSGKVSKPSTTSSRDFNWPAAIQPAISRAASAYRAA